MFTLLNFPFVIVTRKTLSSLYNQKIIPFTFLQGGVKFHGCRGPQSAKVFSQIAFLDFRFSSCKGNTKYIKFLINDWIKVKNIADI